MSMGHLPRQHRPSPLWPLVLLVVLLSACCLHCWLLFLPPAFSRPPSFIPLWLINSAGPSAPFHRAGSYFPPPSHCRLAQVHVLQRHGSRYPTSHVGQSIQAALWKLQRVASQLDPSLEFVKSYRYQLAEALLVPLGVRESFDAGSEFAQRYASLVNSELPFIRASLSTRVVDSATNFTAGLLCHLKLPYNQSSLQPLLISERENSNNPLDNNACPKAHASEEPQIWLETFAIPLAQKLNQLAPGAALNTNDIIALMKLCIFDSIAVEKESEFCRLFSKKNWESFEYYFDLKKIYDHGIRNPLARLQGSGYVAELLSRLTGQREWVQRDQTKVNHTLDESEKGFPLGLKSYVDFTHDNQ